MAAAGSNGGNTQNWKHALAGGVAGVSNVLILHPLDVVKTRLQVQDGMPRAELPAYRGLVHALKSIIRSEGYAALYAGLAPAVVGSCVSWSAYFCAYNHVKERNKRWARVDQLSPQMHLASAAEAGAVVSVLTNPLWVVKTRLQLQRGAAKRAGPAPINVLPDGAKRYNGFVHAVKCIAKEEGLAGFYRGLGPSLLLVSHGAIQFMVYEELKRSAAALRRGGEQDLTSSEISLMGATSKLAASLVTYPQQVVRARLQQRATMYAMKYQTPWKTLQTTVRREGIAGLYKGLVPNVLRVMPSSAITFVVYENVMRALSRL